MIKTRKDKIDIRFVVTTNCNADCFFCLNEYIGSRSSKTRLKPEDYGKIALSAKKLGIEECTITGGEPTLRDDLKEIISCIKLAGLRVTLVSNGYLLNGHLNIYDLIDELHISYHSFNKKAWERITKVKNGPLRVKKNLKVVRKNNPSLKIKLNVVADEKNRDKKVVQKYIDLARELNLEISVFQNGYLRLLKEMGRLNTSEEPSEFWDLKSFGGKLVKKTRRKKTYNLDGVKITLAYLSSEMASGKTLWVTPMGEGFADIRKRSPLINFNPSLIKIDYPEIEKDIKSLSKEAVLLKELEHEKTDPLENEKYKELINYRKENLITIKNKYFF